MPALSRFDELLANMAEYHLSRSRQPSFRAKWQLMVSELQAAGESRASAEAWVAQLCMKELAKLLLPVSVIGGSQAQH